MALISPSARSYSSAFSAATISFHWASYPGGAPLGVEGAPLGAGAASTGSDIDEARTQLRRKTEARFIIDRRSTPSRSQLRGSGRLVVRGQIATRRRAQQA